MSSYFSLYNELTCTKLKSRKKYGLNRSSENPDTRREREGCEGGRLRKSGMKGAVGQVVLERN